MRSACWRAFREPDRAIMDINRAIMLRPEAGNLYSDRGLVWASMVSC